MTFLPVVERELRVASRRRYIYWTRFFAALGMVALATWIWGWLAEGEPAEQRGQIVFQSIAWIAFSYSLIAGIGITADSLSEEKREGTLGLLFLTDLKGYDVVLGKLTATSLNALYRLFSVFPILAIPLLLGALTLGEFWRTALVLTNTLFFSLSAGMLISSVSQRERQAMAGTFVLILIVTAGPPLIGLVDAARSRGLGYNPAWLLTSTVYPALLAFDIRYKVNPQLFWSAVGTTHLFAWAFLALASRFVRHTWQDRPATGAKARWQDRWRAWQYRHGPVRAAYRNRLLELNPVCWLVSRDRMKPVQAVGVLSGLAVAWLGLWWKYGNALLDPTFCVLASYAAHTLIKIWLAAEACRPLAEDRRTGALELVLSTPLAVDEILEGQILALKRQFGWPVALSLGADFLILLTGMSDRVMDNSQDWVLLCLGIVILFLADLYTLAWVGLWLSLNTRKPSRALYGTIARVLILPWVLLVLGLGLLATIQWQGFEPGEIGLLVSAFALALLNDALFLSWARTNLRSRFRLTATQRFDTPGASSRDQGGVAVPEIISPAALAR